MVVIGSGPVDIPSEFGGYSPEKIPPVIVTERQLEVLQASIESTPVGPVVGVAVKEIILHGPVIEITVTVTVSVVVIVPSVAVRVYTEVAESGPVERPVFDKSVLETPGPITVALVQPVVSQAREAEPPAETLVGVPVNEFIVQAGVETEPTFTHADFNSEPTRKINIVSAVTGPVETVPEGEVLKCLIIGAGMFHGPTSA